jgi:hypothetical protein
MPRALLKSILLISLVLAAVSTCVLPLQADDRPADKYSETGNVLSTISKHGHFYQISTDSKVYLLLCTKVKSIQFGEPECKLSDKPIANGDTVHFRIDGDWAYMAPATGESMEEKLRVLATELKVTPPLPSAPTPATAPTGTATTSSTESGVVVGTGTHIKGQKGGGFWSTNRAPSAPAITTASAATPVMATAPVTAVPVTGGAPVVVMPVGPTTGGVVTGVPVTGGPPITAVPTAPVTGVPVGGAPAGGGVVMGGSAPQWVHILRIQTAGKIYQLECSGKPCAMGNKEIALGDNLTIRVDKKHAYLSSGAAGSAPEQEFKILEISEVGTAAEAKPH